MVEKTVLLKIRTLHNGEEDVRVVCDGKLSEKDGGYVVSFAGDVSLGICGNLNSVEVYGDETFVFGFGSDYKLMLGNRMTLATGDVSNGDVPVRFFVPYLKNTLTPSGGNVEIDYIVSTPTAPSARERFEMSVAE